MRLINNALKKRGITTWFDDEKMRGDIVMQMTGGIDDSLTTIVFITESYIEKVSGKAQRGGNDNCKVEFDYSIKRKGVENMISVIMEPDCANTSTWTGGVGGYLSSKLFYDFTDDTKLKSCVDNLVSEIEHMFTSELCREGGEI